MYHEEKVFDGILYWRGTPDGKWTPFSLMQLTKKYMAQKAEHEASLTKMKKEIAGMKKVVNILKGRK